ncbi:hypothetical protein F3G06_00155 [Bacteroides salyersiae]|uniref:hypothetical protein n=1 Tax=Bacteroides salyersiae TaxID=291644 RepID=UPI00123080C2|nr:hypothetical protein [Bacteroides salyersiae]KAA3716481.1 hypothetical protein F3G06_00155 [Bacteroides salyersiae]
MNDKYLKIVFSFLLLIFSLSAYSQKECAGQINLYNDKGEKNGFWREQNNYRITELYYQNGIEDGLCRIYNIKGKLQYMGYYKKGEMSDIWYDFGDYGHLLSICKDFADNTIRISYNGGQTWWLHKYKCYYRSYYPNGNIEKEGMLLWTESPLMDDSVEYGEWKYYDENGNLIKTKFVDELGRSH